ncbi:hypothetical protein HZB88_00455, partial [archaeon]|nr:hypothetical protein [archaeon]
MQTFRFFQFCLISLFLLTAIGMVGATNLFSYITGFAVSGPCGDGTCDSFESRMPNLCPEDCLAESEESTMEEDEVEVKEDENTEELTIEQLQQAETLEEKKQLVMAHFNELKDLINENIEKLPSILLTLFGDTRANVYVGDFAVVGIATEEGVISEMQLDGISEPDITVMISEEALEQMVNKEITIEEALNNKLITYEAVGILNKAKFG